jgi:hypothetical protein
MLKNYAQGEGSSKKSVLLLKVGFLNIMFSSVRCTTQSFFLVNMVSLHWYLMRGQVAIALEKAALSDEYFIKRKLYPNVDYYSGLIYRYISWWLPCLLFSLGFPCCSSYLLLRFFSGQWDSQQNSSQFFLLFLAWLVG